jgi:ComF family protein
MSPASLISKALALVWPARCAACDRFVDERAVFCGACAHGLDPLVGLCPGCALPPEHAPTSSADKLCRRCRRLPFTFATASASLAYGETIADAIVRMKHGGRRDLGRRLAPLLVPALADVCRRAKLGPGDLALPVPLHVTRLRARGFNQALELARGALAALARTPRLAPATTLPRLERHLLVRTRATRPLGHSSPAARLAEVSGAFAVPDPARIRARRVLLIDDVMTTGATFESCATTLLQAGASEVHVFALARAV